MKKIILLTLLLNCILFHTNAQEAVSSSALDIKSMDGEYVAVDKRNGKPLDGNYKIER